MELFDEIAAKIKGQNKTIVFPEGEDKRILGAAVRLKKDNLVEPILLGDEEAIKEVASKNGFDLAGLQIIDPATYPEDDKQAMFDSLMERRKGKNTPEEIQKMLEDVSYLERCLFTWERLMEWFLVLFIQLGQLFDLHYKSLRLSLVPIELVGLFL